MTKELIEKKRELEKQMDAICKEFEKNGKAIIVEALRPVFEQFPDLLAVQWTGYTPYFNDGDTCEYSSTHTDYPYVQVEEDGDFEECYGESAKFDEPLTAALSVFTDDDMKATFGDHKKITVSRDGVVKVKDYDHE